MTRKMILLGALTAAGTLFQSAGCIARFLGDLAGTSLWLSVID